MLVRQGEAPDVCMPRQDHYGAAVLVHIRQALREHPSVWLPPKGMQCVQSGIATNTQQ